jgi:hypothetical protein
MVKKYIAVLRSFPLLNRKVFFNTQQAAYLKGDMRSWKENHSLGVDG